MKGIYRRLLTLFMMGLCVALFLQASLPLLADTPPWQGKGYHLQPGEYLKSLAIAPAYGLNDAPGSWGRDYVMVWHKDGSLEKRAFLFDGQGAWTLRDPSGDLTDFEKSQFNPIMHSHSSIVPGWPSKDGKVIAYGINPVEISVILNDKGEVWQDDSPQEPYLVQGISGKVIDVASGHPHSSGAVTEDGSVWVWHTHGSIVPADASGAHEVDPVSLTEGADTRPRQVPGLSGIVQMALGISIGAALTKDGDVYAWTRSVKPVKVFSNVYVPEFAKVATSATKDRATCIANRVKWKIGVKGHKTTAQERHDGIQHLLDAMKAEGVTNLREQAYILATANQETGGFASLYEVGNQKYFIDNYEPGTDGGDNVGNTQPGDGWKYRGRGPANITGRYIYTELGKMLGKDFAGNPDLLANPEPGDRIAVIGMRDGLFRGYKRNGHFKKHKLDDYLDANGNFDYVKAREIINGDKNKFFDKKNKNLGTIGKNMAKTAKQVEAALKNCKGQ